MNAFVKLTYNDILLPDRLNCPFYYQPHPVCLAAAREVYEQIEAMDEWAAEVGEGKMFGILVVQNASGEIGYLKAYSGQICGREDWEGWVPAVFDYLQPDGYFSMHECEIVNVNRQIDDLEKSERHRLDCARLANAQEAAANEIGAYRDFMAEQKVLRGKRRQNGEDEQALVKESQFQKAEFKRLKQRLVVELQPLQNVVNAFDVRVAELRHRRKSMSDSLQKWLFSHFVMINGNGEKRNLLDIFAATPQLVPPSGAGECCAPKLLQYAFLNDMKPVAMAEFWWGRSPVGEIRKHQSFYPACQGKCKPILDFMLEGVDVEPNPLLLPENESKLHVVYEDDYLLVVDKPAGMLSVPGKGSRLSALDLVSKQMGSDGGVLPVHRLDMQTSGLLMFAKNADIQSVMQRMFASREVKKRYSAVLEGIYEGPSTGTIELPLSADYINRPRQMVDLENGKQAVTIYNILCTRVGKTNVLLFPQTGRTHQLRVHCAHPDGLGIPIVGDDLYGSHGKRLMLHAECLEFVHPVTGADVQITCKAPF